MRTSETILGGGRLSELSAADRERADRVARRLHAELRALISMFPEEDQGASALARRLGIDRTTCHRVVVAVSRAYPGERVLGQLPGVRGLSLFVDAMRRAGASAGQSDAGEAAVEGFADLIRDLGGSQSRLVRRLERAGVSERPSQAIEESPGDGEVRRALFQAGVRLCGQHSEVSLATFVFRPTPGRADRIDMAQIRGFLGHRMRGDAMAFSVQWWVDPEEARREEIEDRYRTLDRDPIQGRSRGVLLEEFSSRPLPTIVAQGPSEQRVLTIDPTSGREPFDLVTANLVEGAQTHPAHDDPAMHEVWVLGRFPARALIFDVFLHRSMARACIPGIGRYVISPALNETMRRRWLDRFPSSSGGGGRLQLLESDLRQCGHPAYPRYPEVLEHVFERLAWDPREYVGFRCEEAYPQWGAGYCMSFDYGREREDEGGGR